MRRNAHWVHQSPRTAVRDRAAVFLVVASFFYLDLGFHCISYRPESSLSSYLAHAAWVSVVLASLPANKQQKHTMTSQPVRRRAAKTSLGGHALCDERAGHLSQDSWLWPPLRGQWAKWQRHVPEQPPKLVNRAYIRYRGASSQGRCKGVKQP